MPHLSHLPIASAHLDEHVATASTAIPTPAPLVPANVAQTARPASAAYSASTVALSFAFDSVQKTLQVVITDERSGEVLRKIEYNRIPHDVHRPEKLNGLLLNQWA